MIESLKLPFTFDVRQLQADLARLDESLWQPHYNSNDYDGSWEALSLRGAGGDERNIVPAHHSKLPVNDTPSLAMCSYFVYVLSSFECSITSARLLKMKAGAVVKEHRDLGVAIEDGEARLHIPITTNQYVEFFSNGKQITMKEGECWYLNAQLPHRLSNLGTSDRVHLVIDCNVNDWLLSYFPAIIKEYKDEHGLSSVRTSKELNEILAHLREMGTPTSLALAKDIERNAPTAMTETHHG